MHRQKSEFCYSPNIIMVGPKYKGSPEVKPSQIFCVQQRKNHRTRGIYCLRMLNILLRFSSCVFFQCVGTTDTLCRYATHRPVEENTRPQWACLQTKTTSRNQTPPGTVEVSLISYLRVPEEPMSGETHPAQCLQLEDSTDLHGAWSSRPLKANKRAQQVLSKD